MLPDGVITVMPRYHCASSEQQSAGGPHERDPQADPHSASLPTGEVELIQARRDKNLQYLTYHQLSFKVYMNSRGVGTGPAWWGARDTGPLSCAGITAPPNQPSRSVCLINCYQYHYRSDIIILCMITAVPICCNLPAESNQHQPTHQPTSPSASTSAHQPTSLPTNPTATQPSAGAHPPTYLPTHY